MSPCVELAVGLGYKGFRLKWTRNWGEKKKKEGLGDENVLGNVYSGSWVRSFIELSMSSHSSHVKRLWMAFAPFSR